MENAEKMMEKSEERLEKTMKKVEERLENIKKHVGKKAEKADAAMEKYMKKLENKNIEEKIAKFKKLNEKIDSVMAKYMNADISDAKKESYKNLFEYIKALNEEKISELENSDA
jgi:exonuclease VII large subunit